VLRQFEGFQLALALQDTWELIRAVNQYIVKREPWTLAKKADQRQKLETHAVSRGRRVRVTAALIDPVMPEAATRIRGCSASSRSSGAGSRPGRSRQARAWARSNRSSHALKRQSRNSEA
jgi:methionyl-tRNA synthetase